MEYDAISNEKLNKNKSYYLAKSKTLFIKDIPELFTYCTLLTKYKNYEYIYYLAFSNNPINEHSFKIKRTGFGYYTINIKSIYQQLNFKTNTNVKIEHVETDNDIEIYRIYDL